MIFNWNNVFYKVILYIFIVQWFFTTCKVYKFSASQNPVKSSQLFPSAHAEDHASGIQLQFNISNLLSQNDILNITNNNLKNFSTEIYDILINNKSNVEENKEEKINKIQKKIKDKNEFITSNIFNRLEELKKIANELYNQNEKLTNELNQQKLNNIPHNKQYSSKENFSQEDNDSQYLEKVHEFNKTMSNNQKTISLLEKNNLALSHENIALQKEKKELREEINTEKHQLQKKMEENLGIYNAKLLLFSEKEKKLTEEFTKLSQENEKLVEKTNVMENSINIQIQDNKELFNSNEQLKAKNQEYYKTIKETEIMQQELIESNEILEDELAKLQQKNQNIKESMIKLKINSKNPNQNLELDNFNHLHNFNNSSNETSMIQEQALHLEMHDQDFFEPHSLKQEYLNNSNDYINHSFNDFDTKQKELVTLENNFKNIKENLRNKEEDLKSTEKKLQEQQRQIEKYEQDLQEQGQKLKEQQEEKLKMRQEIEEYNQIQEKNNIDLKSTEQKIQEKQEEMKKYEQDLQEKQEEMKKYTKNLQEQGQKLKEQQEQKLKTQQEIDLLFDQLNKEKDKEKIGGKEKDDIANISTYESENNSERDLDMEELEEENKENFDDILSITTNNEEMDEKMQKENLYDGEGNIIENKENPGIKDYLKDRVLKRSFFTYTIIYITGTICGFFIVPVIKTLKNKVDPSNNKRKQNFFQKKNGKIKELQKKAQNNLDQMNPKTDLQTKKNLQILIDHIDIMNKNPGAVKWITPTSAIKDDNNLNLFKDLLIL